MHRCGSQFNLFPLLQSASERTASVSSEEQEIIVADDEEEDGWVDCDTDEEFYEQGKTVHGFFLLIPTSCFFFSSQRLPFVHAALFQ